MIETHDERITAGLDRRLVRRIFSYAASYRRYLVGAVVFLVVTTIGEMLMPVLIQRTIDHTITDHWVRISRRELVTLPRVRESVGSGDNVYVRETLLDHLSPRERARMHQTGTLDTEPLVPVDAAALTHLRDPQRQALERRVVSVDGQAFLPAATLDGLAPHDLRRLRAGALANLRRNALTFGGVLLVVLVGSFFRVYLTAYSGQLVMKRMRRELFGHITRQRLGYLSDQPVGKLVTRVTNDVETINELFTSVLAELLRNVSLMVGVIVTMLSLNLRLGLAVVASMLPIILVTDIFRRRARDAYRRVRRAVSRVNAFLSEHIGGMSIVQLFVQQRRTSGEFNGQNDTLMQAHLSEMYVFATFRPIVDFMATLSTAVVVFVGARLFSVELVSLGVLIAFVNLIRRFYMPVMNISEQFTVLQSAMAGSERVFQLLDTDESIPDSGTLTVERDEIRGRIEFDAVRFGYRRDEPVLRGLEFSVDPGEMVAIVGHTGAGKTTIINLLTRLWDVDAGSIRLDGRDIRDYRLDALRSAVQQIQQDVHLFSTTIGENITLGRQSSEQEIWRACTAVQIADAIRELPEALDTPVRERGVNLSAGQRQLISFARVLVHDPPVLVLDEATSSVDSETEDKLQRAVAAVTRGRTSLVIAHRLSTIREAHRIIVLSGGVVVESGTHETLMASGGRYATLYQLQYRQQDSHR